MNLLFEKFKESLLGEELYIKHLRNKLHKILKSPKFDLGKFVSYSMHYCALKHKKLMYVNVGAFSKGVLKFSVSEFEEDLEFKLIKKDDGKTFWYKDAIGRIKDAEEVLNEMDNYMQRNLQINEDDKKRYGRAR